MDRRKARKGLSPFVAVFAIVGSLVFVVGSSLAVGHWEAREDEFLDWELAAIVGTALGTTLLAGFTAALARATSGDVSVTRELAELARTPRVVLHSVQWSGFSHADSALGYLNVELYNVGAGPAVNVHMRARYLRSRTPPEFSEGRWSAIAPNGIRAAFALGVRFTDPPSSVSAEDFELSGQYTDWTRQLLLDVARLMWVGPMTTVSAAPRT